MEIPTTPGPLYVVPPLYVRAEPSLREALNTYANRLAGPRGARIPLARIVRDLLWAALRAEGIVDAAPVERAA